MVIPLACIAAAAMVFVSEGSYWRSVGALDEIGAMGVARSRIQGLLQSILDAETAQRAYLATGTPRAQQAYEQALQATAEAFDFLDTYYGRDPATAAQLDQLHTMADAKLDDLAQAMRSRDLRQARAAAVAGSGAASGAAGREQMQTIRQRGAGLLEHESRTLAASRADLYQTLMMGRIGVAVLSAVSLLALALLLRQTAALERQQREQQRLVQAEHDRLEILVAERTAQLTELTRHLQTAREDERHRLARDLHDELGALLTAAKLDAARIRSRLGNGAPEAQERLAHLVATLDAVIALKRRITEELRPSALSHLGLVATLEILAREFAERSGVEVHCTLTPVPLAPTAELMIYRVVQEAITNIAKHAQARQVRIGLSVHDGQVQASVRDDGVGFDPTRPTASAYGLVGMRFRVEAEGGTLAVESAPGRGTEIRVRLPAAAAAAAG